MSDWMLLYLWTRLDALQAAGLVMLVAGFAAAVVAFGMGMSESDDMLIRIGKRLIVVPVIGAMLAITVPNKTDLAIIVGGKIALDAGRSETAKEVGREVLDAVRAQLKKAAQ